MIQSKLSSKFQLSIPKSIREDLKLQAGQKFTWVSRGNIIELIPLRPVKEARGMLAPCEYKHSSEYRDRQKRML